MLPVLMHFDLSPSPNFMEKNREYLAIFFMKDFLHLLQSKLGHKYKSETYFPAFRPSVHVLEISLIFIEN